MGNWRTVDMRGRMNPVAAKEMIEELTYGDDWSKWATDAACLMMNHSLCGLNQWVNNDGTIDTVGNLAERDFDNDDIEKALTFLAFKYPSLEMTLHSGSDWESTVCSATFHVKDGKVQRCEPEVENIREISDEVMQSRLLGALFGC